MSVKEIERRLRVSRSSVSRWVKDIQLGEERRRALAARVTEGRLQAAERKARAARVLRDEYQQEGRRFARERGGSYAAGCMLHLERQQEIEQFWLTALGLPSARLGKSVVNTYSKYSRKKRKNKLPYGTCKLTVYSTRIVQTIFGSIQEYGGFDRPGWLD